MNLHRLIWWMGVCIDPGIRSSIPPDNYRKGDLPVEVRLAPACGKRFVRGLDARASVASGILEKTTVTFRNTILASLCFTLLLPSCAAMKKSFARTDRTEAVETEAAAKLESVPEAAAPEPEANLPREIAGFRMSNMLELPSDGEFRATNPSLTRSGTAASPVFSRPPTDPPSRIRPNADETGNKSVSEPESEPEPESE
jgi:hypothetical protein